MSSEKPREWWILRESGSNRALLRSPGEKWDNDVDSEPCPGWVHVIEKSAYDAQAAELDGYKKRFGSLEIVPRMRAKRQGHEWWAVINLPHREGTIAKFDRTVQYEQNVEHLHLVEHDEYDRICAERDSERKDFCKLMNEASDSIDRFRAERELQDADYAVLLRERDELAKRIELWRIMENTKERDHLVVERDAALECMANNARDLHETLVARDQLRRELAEARSIISGKTFDFERPNTECVVLKSDYDNAKAQITLLTEGIKELQKLHEAHTEELLASLTRKVAQK